MNDTLSAHDFAAELRDADDPTVWNAFGRDLQDAVDKTDAPFVAIGLSVEPDALHYARHELRNVADADAFRSAIGVGVRQTADGREAAESLPITDAADAAVVFPADWNEATVGKVRDAVADAIDPTADA